MIPSLPFLILLSLLPSLPLLPSNLHPLPPSQSVVVGKADPEDEGMRIGEPALSPHQSTPDSRLCTSTEHYSGTGLDGEGIERQS